MEDDDWVRAAMADDLQVVELLVRLRRSETHASPAVKRAFAVVPLEWGMRQRRSRQRCSVGLGKKEGESRRASPTTPLSWSGGTSFSGGGGAVDCYEESSRPAKRSCGGRSKVTSTNETNIRRSRKKKTFAELKEEESLFLKERVQLKKKLATLRIIYDEQRARNECLKRAKVDLQFQLAKKADSPVVLKEAICDGPHHMEADSIDHTPTIMPTSVTRDELDAVVCSSPPSDSCEVPKKDVASGENFFVLPDLNLPIEVDSSSDTLCGMS